MSISIHYNDERIFKSGSGFFYELKEKLSYFTKQIKLDQKTNLSKVIDKFETQPYLFINKEIPKNELKTFAKLVELAVNRIIEEGYFDVSIETVKSAKKVKEVDYYYSKPKAALILFKNKVKRISRKLDYFSYEDEKYQKRSPYRFIIKITFEKDLLFFSDNDTLKQIQEDLLFIAEQKKLDPKSNLIQFICNLTKNETEDIAEKLTAQEIVEFSKLITEWP